MTFVHRTFLVIVLILAAAGMSGCRAPQPPAWEALPLGTRADIRGLWFTDAQHGWIVGGGFQIPGGLVGRTEDGGRTWRYTSDLAGASTDSRMSVLAVHLFDTERGLVGTDTGAILSTTDAGENWARVGRLAKGLAVSRFFFLDDQRGWAVGLGGVLRTEDGGQRWTPATSDETGTRLAGRAVHFLDDRTGWVAGMHASLMRTADGGETWESATLALPAGQPDFWDVFFVGSEIGWVVGDEGTILTTRDGGGTWQWQNSGIADAYSAVKLERIPRNGKIDVIDAGDRTPGLTLSAVRFLDKNRGWVAGYYAGLGRSLILRTDDGGATWVVDADIAGEELHALFVRDREWLWAVGARVREGAQSIYRRSLSAAPRP